MNTLIHKYINDVINCIRNFINSSVNVVRNPENTKKTEICCVIHTLLCPI